MTPQELYEKYKGKKTSFIALNKRYTGYVVGFSTDYAYPDVPLIIGLIEPPGVCGWTYIESTDNILDMIDNTMGYAYGEVKDVVFKFGR